MAIGAQVRRVPAIGGGQITDANIFKMILIGQGERGIAENFGNIFNFGDFEEVAGGFNVSKRMAYIARSFYDALKINTNVEIILRTFQASDAVQATGIVNDTDGAPEKVYDVKSAYRNLVDKSAGGNLNARKVLVSEDVTVALTADSTASASTVFTVEAVDQLKIGDLFKVVDTGTAKEEFAFITAIDKTARTITFAALSNATAYEAATSTVFRQDVTMETYKKNNEGVFQLRETFGPFGFQQSDTVGLVPAMSDVDLGSKLLQLDYNEANSTAAEFARPAADASPVALTSGADGTAPVDADWATLVDNLKDERTLVLLAPESQSIAHANNMNAFTTSNNRALYEHAAAEGADEDNLKNLGTNIRGDIKFGMVPVDKWIKFEDPINPGEKISIPSVGISAAHLFNQIKDIGIKKNAAGQKEAVNTLATLDLSNGLTHNDEDGVGERLLKNHSINTATFKTGKGIVINTARTLSTNAGYQFQNQVTGFLFLKFSILPLLENIEQDNIGQELLDDTRIKIRNFGKRLFNLGVFLTGTKSDGTAIKFEDVFILKNDLTVNTLDKIKQGILTTFLQVVFAPPVETPELELASADATTIL